MKRGLLLAVIPLVFFLLLGAAGRHGGPPRAEQAAAAPMPKFEYDDKSTLRQILTYDKELDLTDAQIEIIRQIRTDSINAARKKYETLSAAQKALAEIISQVKPDFVSARAKIREVTEIAIDIQTGSIDAFEKAFNTLTGEQKAKFYVIRAKLSEAETGGNGVEKSQ